MKIFIKSTIVVVLIGICMLLTTTKLNKHNQQLNIYIWYGAIPKSVFEDFEKETGIKVIRSFYDSNETLEANVITGNSGYDLVFPSFVPYAYRQNEIGLYQSIDRTKIPNIKYLDTTITSKFIDATNNIDNIIPIFYTVIGILYNKNVIQKLFGRNNITYDHIFNVENLKLLHEHGVNFPSEYIDVFPQLEKYINLTHYSRRDIVLKCINHIDSIKKYIKKFFSSTIINDFISGEMSVAICSSDNAFKISKYSKDVGFSTGGNNGVIAIECVAIPRGATNVDNAYKFIDYILRPDISQRITQHSGIFVNTNANINNVINGDIKIDNINSYLLLSPNKNKADDKYNRICAKLWTQVTNSKKRTNISIDQFDDNRNHSIIGCANANK